MLYISQLRIHKILWKGTPTELHLHLTVVKCFFLRTLYGGKGFFFTIISNDVAHLTVIKTEAARICKKVGHPGTILRNVLNYLTIHM